MWIDTIQCDHAPQRCKLLCEHWRGSTWCCSRTWSRKISLRESTWSWILKDSTRCLLGWVMYGNRRKEDICGKGKMCAVTKRQNKKDLFKGSVLPPLQLTSQYCKRNSIWIQSVELPSSRSSNHHSQLVKPETCVLRSVKCRSRSTQEDAWVGDRDQGHPWVGGHWSSACCSCLFPELSKQVTPVN